MKKKKQQRKRGIRGGDTGQYLVKGSHRICYRCGSGYLYGGQHQSECPEERPGDAIQSSSIPVGVIL